MALNLNTLFNTIPTYTPSIAWYKEAVNANEILFCSSQKYNRNWHANKTNLVGANGSQFLSIPLLGGRNQRVAFNEVAINYETDWQKQHFRSLETMYGRSPYFEYFAHNLKDLYNSQHLLLQDWNLATIYFINTCLGFKMPLIAETDAVLPAISLGIETNVAYTQVFMEKHGFVANASMLDMLLCLGPKCLETLSFGDRKMEN